MHASAQTKAKVPASPPPTAPREFSFTSKDFARIRRLVWDRAGITLAPGESERVYRSLAGRLRIHGLSSLNSYLQLLTRGKGAEWSHFVGALTARPTSFFHEQHHFPILSAHLAAHSDSGRIRLWSCGAGTGEEAYSMAITAAETFGSLTPPVRILATDVDRCALEQAREGVYPADRMGQLPEWVKQRYFQPEGAASFRVRPQLRRLIFFLPMNLLDPVWPAKDPFDAVFCRNVMVYYDPQIQTKIAQRVRRHLQPDGLFFAGSSDHRNFEELYSPCGNTVYRPKLQAGEGA